MAWSPWAALRFCAGGALVFAAAYAVSEAVDPVYPEMRARVALFRERAPAVEAVAVGNSHGAALDFAALGVQGMHFTMAGQDAFEGAYLARYAAAEAPRLRYVLFTASYGALRKDHALVGAGDVRSRRRQLYARTPLQRPIEGDGDLWLAGKLSPVVRDDHWKGVAGRPVRKRPPSRLDAYGRLIGPPYLPVGRDSLVRYGVGVAAMHRQLGAETMELAPDTPARVAARLHALAGELRARGVALVVYTPPYHETYLRALDPAVDAEADAAMRRIAADNPNVLWLDYSADPRFAGRDDLFRNSDHLNPAGGRALSLLLRECLGSTLAGTRATAAGGPGCPAAAGPGASARPLAAGGAASTRNAAEEPQ